MRAALMPSRRLAASLWDRVDSMSGDFDAAPHLSMHADSSAAKVVPPARYSLMNPAIGSEPPCWHDAWPMARSDI